MTESQSTECLRAASARLREAVREASQGLVERESLVELIVLAAVAGEHLLVIGPPGTAKSEGVRRVAKALGGKYFEYLLGRFTEPGELFGPIDLRKLREGVMETDTTGMLPEAEIVFLDEVFQGSTAILNTLLGILNERTFMRGRTPIKTPLRVCVGASNLIPQEESLAAFADRFLLRAWVEPIADPRLEELLEGGWNLGNRKLGTTAALSDIDLLASTLASMDLSTVRSHLAHAIRALRSAGVQVSDRRAVRMQRLVAAAALLAGRELPTVADIWPIISAIPTREGQEIGREKLRDLLAASENATLPAAAELASAGKAARALRLAEDATRVLQQQPSSADDLENLQAWKYKVEGLAREIDACFAPESMPDSVSQVRQKIVAILSTQDSLNGKA